MPTLERAEEERAEEERAADLSRISPHLNTPAHRAALALAPNIYYIRDIITSFEALHSARIADEINCNFIIRYLEWNTREMATSMETGSRYRGTGYPGDILRDCAREGVLIGPVRDFLITQDTHFVSLTSCLQALQRAGLLTDVVRDTLFANPAHADHISVILNGLARVQELTEDNYQTIYANIAHLTGLAAAYKILHENNKLTPFNCLALLADPAHAETIANRLAHPTLPQLFFDRAHIAFRYVRDRLVTPTPLPPRIAFMSARDLVALAGREDVLRRAQSPTDFYRLDSTHAGYDQPTATEGAHSGPEIRKMLYLFSCLKREDVIPRDPHRIKETISSLIDFANRLDVTTLSDSAVRDTSTRRMFKIGVDKCLRHNERVITGYSHSSRELILGLYNLIRKKEADKSLSATELRELKSQFVMGVRQYIEAQETDGACVDPYCLTAAYKGFFPRDPEASDTTGVFTYCHGRLKNISSSTAVVIGYPSTLGEELLYILRELDLEGRGALFEKLQQADICDPETLNFTGSRIDTVLYRQGINRPIFANLFQLASKGTPDDVSPEIADQIRHVLEEIDIQFGERRAARATD